MVINSATKIRARTSYKTAGRISTLWCAALLFSAGYPISNVRADDPRIERLEQELQTLQAEINELKKNQQHSQPASSTTTAAPAPAQQVQATNSPDTSRTLNYASNVKLTLGGYVEAAGIARSKNESADVGSKFNLGSLTSPGIPLPNNPNDHISEFRGSARQSKITLLAEGKTEKDDTIAAYVESDFLGAGTTSNSNESNSYTPRLRQAYGTFDDDVDGWHFLAGQAWSLLTQDKTGITPRQENIPQTIDAQYVPGFNWTRNWQLRAVKDFDKKVWFGISAESPEASIYTNGFTDNAVMSTTGSVVTFNNSGGQLLNSGSSYSIDHAPDLIAKLAFDPGWGHYELYGLARFFTDRVGDSNKNTAGGGGGASALVPLVPKYLDAQASFLAGKGIGRYGSAQFNDVVVNSNTGALTPIREVEALVGLVGHPSNDWDIYLYGGTEDVGKTAVTDAGTYGYGNPNLDNSTCSMIGSTTCTPNASDIWQGTVGAWWKFYQGQAGMMKFGASYSYTRAGTFDGIGGSPSSAENIGMISFRYYPFQ